MLLCCVQKRNDRHTVSDARIPATDAHEYLVLFAVLFLRRVRATATNSALKTAQNTTIEAN